MSIKRDKWMQYRILKDTSSLAARLPKTRLLKLNELAKLLLQFQSLVLKPRDGRFGRDILFISRNGANSYRIHNEKKTVTMKDTEQLLKWIGKKTKGRGYIVQSIPGICGKIAATVLSEIGEINRFNHAKKLVAFAGVDPSVFSSGKFTATTNRITKRALSN